MHCPTCNNRMIGYPSSPAWFWHCRMCGTAEMGAADRVVVVPDWVAAMRESKDTCLRDDRAQCMVWLLASRKGD